MPFNATARCATPGQIALAATSSPWVLPEPVRGHLLTEDCPVCAQALSERWARTCPPEHLLRAFHELPPGGVFADVLSLHFEVCDQPACSAARAAAQAPAALERPAALEERRWRIVAERLRARALDSFAFSRPAAGAMRSGRGEGARRGGAPRPRRFPDAGVVVRADRDDPARTSVAIDEAQFARGALLLLLQAADGELLIEHVYAGPDASPAIFPVAPERALADGVAVFVAPVPDDEDADASAP